MNKLYILTTNVGNQKRFYRGFSVDGKCCISNCIKEAVVFIDKSTIEVAQEKLVHNFDIQEVNMEFSLIDDSDFPMFPTSKPS